MFYRVWKGQRDYMDRQMMAEALRTLALTQEQLWRADRGDRFQHTTEEMRTIAFAMIAEVLELSDEIGWKSWKPAPIVDKQRVLEEYADVMAFFGTLTALVIVRCGFSPEQLVEAYLEKAEINRNRFRDRPYGVDRWIPEEER